ncbi:hypothetical protein Q9R08_05060 [Microbacterium sp. QXD-8]|uniref:Uncharacterized protein n=1 Tax=Microbacterium psychrotolerans TaxID=3068321 RepID=A0ABU0YYE4_9MICO|nr:hypothetical protein [Microbacterium sp. QXD-8]MDQ7877342.1 hypothetical protein [Microbacterium sp. QXD-8]
MSEWFRSDDIPGIDKLPITRHVAEILNEADPSDGGDVLRVATRALVFATGALETRQNQLMTALGVTENGLPPGEYDGSTDIRVD